MEESEVSVEVFYLAGKARMGAVDHLHHVFAVEVVAVGVQGGGEAVQAALLERSRTTLHHFTWERNVIKRRD
jgi:hypothetical protein